MKTALLLSGGMDSLALAWWKRPSVTFTVDYGQKAANAEANAAEAVCAYLGIEHHVISIDCSPLGSGDMALAAPDRVAPSSDWWPYRNQLLITLVAMKAITLGVNKLLIGTVRADGSHRDGTSEFVRRMSDLISYQEGKLTVDAPAIGMSTVELLRHARVPADLLAWAHSCHKANLPCGNCRGCNKYLETYLEVGYDLDRSR